jgi:hypothetical protein
LVVFGFADHVGGRTSALGPLGILMRRRVHLTDQASSLILDCADGGPFAFKEHVVHHRRRMPVRQILTLKPIFCGFEQESIAIEVDFEKLKHVDHVALPAR